MLPLWTILGFFDFKAKSDRYTEQPDHLLLRAWQRSGEQHAFHALVARYEDDIWRYIQRRLRGQRANWEELLQETFLRLVRNPPALMDGELLRPWLYRVARNLIIDHYRASDRKPERAEVDLDAFASSSDTHKAAELSMLREKLQECVAKLPAEQAEALILRHEEGLSFAEIAEILDVNVNTVKSRVRYALVGLKTQLKRLDLEPDSQSKEAS